jgi:hypothetical protein
MKRALAALLVLGTAVYASRCADRNAAERGAPPPDASGAGSQAAPASDADAVERLRSLGYVGFVAGKDDGRGNGVVEPGYSLIVNARLCSAALMDEDGALANFWRMEDCYRWDHAELTGDGELILAGTDGNAAEEDLNERRFIVKLSWQGREIWRRRYPAHHDVHVRPDGRILAILADDRVIPEVNPKVPVRDNGLALLSPEGVELERMGLYDLFLRNRDRVALRGPRRQRPDRLDLFHVNSIEELPPASGSYGPVPERVLISVRHQDTVAILDWKNRRFEWVWGPGVISGQHDATRLASGNMLMFDNGVGRGWSRVIELDPRSREIVWQYAAPRRDQFYTLSRGSNQRLPNGNTLIAESDRGHAFEVTPAGKIVWDFWNPFRNEQGERATIVRIQRFDRRLIDSIVARFGEGRRTAPVTPTAQSP